MKKVMDSTLKREQTTTPITRCERCGRERVGIHDDGSCQRCHASAGQQYVRWVKVDPKDLRLA